MQMSQEYLAHSQQYLETIETDLQTEYQSLQFKMEVSESLLQKQREELQSTKIGVKKKKAVLKSYELFFEDEFPAEEVGLPFTCEECSKTLPSLYELKMHYHFVHMNDGDSAPVPVRQEAQKQQKFN